MIRPAVAWRGLALGGAVIGAVNVALVTTLSQPSPAGADMPSWSIVTCSKVTPSIEPVRLPLTEVRVTLPPVAK